MGTVAVEASSFNLSNYTEDLSTLMMRVLSGRAEILDEQVRAQAQAISDKNNLLKQANYFLGQAREQKESAGDNANHMPRDMVDFFNNNGINFDTTGGVGDYIHDKSEWDVNIEYLQGFIDSLTSTSQMDLIDLQSTMDKYGETFDLLTNFLSKYAGKIDAIIGNIR